MTPIVVQVGAVERVQLEIPTRSEESVAANAVERVQLIAPSTISVTIGG